MIKKSAVFLSLFIAVFAYAAGGIPKPEGWVNDFAGVISPEYKEKIGSLIENLEQKTSAEIAVVTVSSIAPYDEKEYARLVFDSWRPGKKGKDNGVLILLAVKERRWRIETGYGVEGVLPDSLCGKIGRAFMAPYFKQGNYGEGLYRGVAAAAKAINGEPLVFGADGEVPAGFPLLAVLIIGALIFRVLIVFFPGPFFGGYYGGFGGLGSGGSGGFGGFGGGGGFGGFGGGGGGGGAGGGW